MAGYTGNIEASLPELYRFAGVQTDVAAATRALDTASFIIEIISGVIFEAEYRELFLKPSDARCVKAAVIAQAAWMLEHTEALTRLGASSVSQDGLSVSATDDTTFILAPLAKRALDNCSWARSGTHRIAATKSDPRTSYMVSDDHPWTPMGGA